MQDWTSFYNCQQPEFVWNICGRHSLSEQMTPAENFAADFWQLTVLWCWHWLSDISVPVHFTPLITISVTLLLSQYHVSLDSGFRKQTNRRTKKKYSALIRKLKLQRVQFGVAEKQMFMTHLWLLAEDTVWCWVYVHWRTITSCRHWANQ